VPDAETPEEEMFVDTHAHLDFPQFESDIAQTVQRAIDSGVGRIINIGTSVQASRRVVEIAEAFESCYAAVGVHPHDAKDVDEACLRELEKLGSHEKVVAVGEIGLDFYRNLSPKEAQVEAFKRLLDLAVSLDLPVVIHARDATSECLEILAGRTGLRGVMHCFSSSPANARRAFDMGLLVSCCGQITFPNAQKLREKFARIPPEKFMLETDAPFLAPQKYRGKRNEPAYIPLIAGAYAQVFGISVEELEEITTRNAMEVFGI
jgi:TatD DNase family protein